MTGNKERDAIRAMLKMLFGEADESKKIIITSDWGKPYTLMLPDGSHTHCSYDDDNNDSHLELAVDSFVEHLLGGSGLSFHGPPGGGQVGHGASGELTTALPSQLPTERGSAHETPAPQSPGGLHIPTLIRLKEIIDTDEELHQCIASGDGWSIIDGIIDRLIKPPAAASEGEPQVAEGEKKVPETRKGDEADRGDAAGPQIPPASTDTAGGIIVCGEDTEPCDFRAYAGLEEAFCKRKRGVCKYQTEMKK